MTRSFKTLWDQFLFRDKGLLPTPRLVIIVSALSLGLVGLSFTGASWALIIAVDAVVLLLSLLDLFVSPKKNQLTFERLIEEELERGSTYEAVIEIKNHSHQQAIIQVGEDFPQTFERPFPLRGRIPAHQGVALTYPFTAHVRGDYAIDYLYVRYRSLLGLWEKQMKVELKENIRVIPDLGPTRHLLENAQQFLLYEGEQIKKRQQGTGEFSKVRKYVVGDDLRKINWRQTAKLQELMTNEYEPEHGKIITIMIDCGRMMGVELEEDNRLEKALEAAITVIAAALKKGDYVSVIAFSKEVKVYIPPARGMSHLQTILKEIYNLKVDSWESNYADVFQYLQTMQKKRSLLFLFSDVSTFLYEESSLIYLQRLRKKHVFFMIGVEDQVTEEKADMAPLDSKTAMTKSMAQRHILEKKSEMVKWERQGLQMIEAPEEQLATTAVSHYIQIMNRGLL